MSGVAGCVRAGTLRTLCMRSGACHPRFVRDLKLVGSSLQPQFGRVGAGLDGWVLADLAVASSGFGWSRTLSDLDAWTCAFNGGTARFCAHCCRAMPARPFRGAGESKMHGGEGCEAVAASRRVKRAVIAGGVASDFSDAGESAPNVRDGACDSHMPGLASPSRDGVCAGDYSWCAFAA